MFNIQGSELVFLLLIALIVLGPEKLPDAIRKFGRAYAEFKKMANGFQGELRDALDEPMRELRDTADAMRAAANFDVEGLVSPPPVADEPAEPAPPVRREQGLNFGSANPKRQERTAADGEAPAADAEVTAPPPAREPGLNFGSANPRRTGRAPRDPAAPEPVVDVDPAAPEPVVDVEPVVVEPVVDVEGNAAE